jgi:hypothetical protein
MKADKANLEGVVYLAFAMFGMIVIMVLAYTPAQ